MLHIAAGSPDRPVEAAWRKPLLGSVHAVRCWELQGGSCTLTPARCREGDTLTREDVLAFHHKVGTWRHLLLVPWPSLVEIHGVQHVDVTVVALTAVERTAVLQQPLVQGQVAVVVEDPAARHCLTVGAGPESEVGLRLMLDAGAAHGAAGAATDAGCSAPQMLVACSFLPAAHGCRKSYIFVPSESKAGTAGSLCSCSSI